MVLGLQSLYSMQLFHPNVNDIYQHFVLYISETMEKFNLGFISSLSQSIDKYILDEIITMASQIKGEPLDDYNSLYSIVVLRPTIAMMTAPLFSKRFCINDKINIHNTNLIDFMMKVNTTKCSGVIDSNYNLETGIVRINSCVMALTGFEKEVNEAVCVTFLIFLDNMNNQSAIPWSRKFKNNCFRKINEINSRSLSNNLFLTKLSQALYYN